MKPRLLLWLLSVCLLLTYSCSRKPQSTLLIQNGDLLFVGLPYDYTLGDSTDMSSAITVATGEDSGINYIHVAILEVDDNDSVWVIDATLKHGVDRYPFSTFLSDFTLDDGSYPQLDVMRLKDNTKAANYVANAKTYCGRAYDLYFLPNNDEQYCSELVRNAYRNDTSSYIFSQAPMNFQAPDGTFPPYWVYLFKLIDQPIPQGEMGTNPNSMSKESCLMKVTSLENGELRTER
ncbi:MAG: hypothetical protein IKR71_09880 [Bacteroidales bacterium]|nr:hypothetical protein [Bacteroidales bacterium]